MNGDHAEIDEPTSEMDDKTDLNKQNHQSDQTVASQYVPNKLEHMSNGSSCQNSTMSAIHHNEESTGDDKTIEECVDGDNDKSGKSERGFSENKTCDGEDSSNDTDFLAEDKSQADSNRSQFKNSESMNCTKSIDETDSQEMLDISDNIDQLSNNDSQEILPDNSHQDSENTNNSLDSNEVMKSEEIKILMLEEKVAANSRESTCDSEVESCQYIDDTVDPISSSDPKEEHLIDKIDNKSLGTGMFKIVTVDRCYDSDENSSDSSRSDDSSRPAKTVNIDSGESSPDGSTVNIGSRESSPDSRDHLKNDIIIVDSARGHKRKKSKPFEIDHIKQSDVIILDADQVEISNGNKSPVIHEICSDNSDNDDCVVTSVEKVKTTKKNGNSTELRRSSRVIKRKKYSDEFDDTNGNDIELVVSEDPLQTKQSKVRIIPKLPGITIKSSKNKTINNKKGNVSISQPLSSKNLTITKSKVNPVSVQNVSQKTTKNKDTLTNPVASKSIEKKEMPSLVIQPEPVLPTLTDDMFVVEAPSFIVPYVYEKPAVVPFKDYVEKWGKEIEEQKLKEEQELLEKKKIEKEKEEEERKLKRERGEEVQEPETEEEAKKTKGDKSEKKEKRRKRNDEDDVSWDGSSSEESEDESSSDEEKEILTIDPKEATVQPKVDSFFDLALGEFFTGIATKLVQEHVQADLLQQQTRKLKREIKSGHVTKTRALSIALLTNELGMSQANNAQYKFEQKKCKFCSFRTESELVLQHHLETPHMKNNEYLCNFCSLVMPNAMNMLFHMDEKHGVKGKLERAPAPHECPNCPFEDHGKSKLGRHLTVCAKKFKPETNLAAPIDWEHPAKIPKLTRARPAVYQVTPPARNPMGSGIRRFSVTAALTPQQIRPIRPIHIKGTILRPRTTDEYNALNAKKLPANHGFVISTAPRLATPIQPLNSNAKGVVMCEICDGYIKDLEQLRSHMQWIHKVKIHPKMIYNRPPLNCQKCHCRFFTDQGLERHLLGSHGLVTSSIQEAANKGKDGGRCPVCGRVYQRKLLAHVSRDHNLVLKPAHLSYKCTVCTATFGMYRQFENHVYTAHSTVGKKLSEKKIATPDKPDANNTTSAKEDTKSTATTKENTEAKNDRTQ